MHPKFPWHPKFCCQQVSGSTSLFMSTSSQAAPAAYDPKIWLSKFLNKSNSFSPKWEDLGQEISLVIMGIKNVRCPDLTGCCLFL